MSKVSTVWITTDSIYGALAFTNENRAIEYIFQGKDQIAYEQLYCTQPLEWRTKKMVKDMLKEGLQVSGNCDEIGSWTLTKTSLIKNGIKLEGWLY